MQNVKTLNMTAVELEDQSECMPPWVNVQSSVNDAEILIPTISAYSISVIEDARKLHEETPTNNSIFSSTTEYPLVSPSPPINLVEFKRKQSKEDRKLAIITKKIVELPWNMQEKTLHQHACDTSYVRNKSAIYQFRRDMHMMHNAIQNPGYDNHG
jgi:hypothetical protein